MTFLTEHEKQRYDRQIVLAEIGLSGQEKLKKSRVLCVGAGALAHAALTYLSAAGVGQLGIIDFDRIELSNLQRQILYTAEDVGKLKVEVTKQRLLALNPHIQVTTYPIAFTAEHAFALIEAYDLVIDASDNYATRYLINDVCFYLKKPDVFASILQFQGQCTVFATNNGPCYRCLFPTPPATLIPNCRDAGVLAMLPGLIGTIQAIEAIKILLSLGESLAGRLLSVHALTMQWQTFHLEKNSECLLCAKNTPFLDLPRLDTNCQLTVPEISPQEFFQLKNNRVSFSLLDVREAQEYAEGNLQGRLIPLAQLTEYLHEFDPQQLIIVHCRSGERGKQAVQLLQKNGFLNVYNLQGGMLAYLNGGWSV